MPQFIELETNLDLLSCVLNETVADVLDGFVTNPDNPRGHLTHTKLWSVVSEMEAGNSGAKVRELIATQLFNECLEDDGIIRYKLNDRGIILQQLLNTSAGMRAAKAYVHTDAYVTARDSAKSANDVADALIKGIDQTLLRVASHNAAAGVTESWASQARNAVFVGTATMPTRAPATPAHLSPERISGYCAND